MIKALDLLENPICIGEENGYELWCDGGDEVPESTLNKDYFTCRKEAHDLGLELMTEDRYRKLQSDERKYDREMATWLESGDNPSAALRAYWYDGMVNVLAHNPRNPLGSRGARRLLRVKLEPSPSSSSCPTAKMSPQKAHFYKSYQEGEKQMAPPTNFDLILQWLDEYDGAFCSGKRWRIEFEKYLKTLLQ